ncbi:hypothetical protein PGW94_02545 [Candidatus Anaplasma sp. TIGMIC]|nr:hypothetical protein [Candidatus Anaplasma sp. TIGMIC]
MKPSKYMADIEAGCSPPQLQQSIFLNNRNVMLHPDTYINDISSVVPQGSRVCALDEKCGERNSSIEL